MPGPSRADRRFLEQHGTKWRVVINVPRDLQKVVGKTKLKQGLDTDSLEVANRLKWAVVGELQSRISHLRSPDTTARDALRLAALRRQIEMADGDVEAVDMAILDRAEAIAGPPVGTDAEGQPVFAHDRDRAAADFANVAFGRRTPITAHRQIYLDHLKTTVKARTRADDERAFRYLTDWCKHEGIPAFLETLGTREAVRFADHLATNSGGRSPVTLNKYIIRLNVFWKWMVKRTAVDTNIWQYRTYTVPQELDDDRERAFTDAEMLRLLNGPATQHMHDLMRIGTLTGARLNAVVSLQVKDCTDGAFTFKPQKRETGSRKVPIHPDLAGIVERRTAGRAPEDDLFPEWPPVRKKGSMRERSFKASNHFTEYRREVGVDDTREGKRRSLVNFHSFRCQANPGTDPFLELKN
jgi:hypothetical protein